MTLARWERLSEWPLAGLATLFLIAYGVPVLNPAISHNWRVTCDRVDLAVWVAFCADYIARIYLAKESRARYFWHHIPDLAVIALPVLRPLRLLRLVMLLKILNRSVTASLRGRIAVYLCGATGLLVLCASLAVLDAERGKPGSTINSFGNALWWAATTITTVGYGTVTPVTTTGRYIAVGLMFGGIALVGLVTASMASWLIDRVRAEQEQSRLATRGDIEALTRRIDALAAELRKLRREIH